MRNNKTKKLLMIFTILLTILGALGISQRMAYAETTVAESFGDGMGPHGANGKFTVEDLLAQYDILCCQKTVHAFTEGDDIITCSNGSTYVVDNNNAETITVGRFDPSSLPTFSSNFSSNVGPGGTVYALSSDYTYEISSERAATPKEAYILAEVNNKADVVLYEYVKDASGKKIELGGSVDESEFSKRLEMQSAGGSMVEVFVKETVDEDGRVTDTKYYVKEDGNYYQVTLNYGVYDRTYGGYLDYVQQAWWTTEAGSKGGVASANAFSIEADEFESYMEEVNAAGGYKVSWNEDANDDGVIDENDNVTVAWDADTQTYKVGPFSINYIKASCDIEGRNPVMFAGITESIVNTNKGELVRVDDQERELEAGEYRYIYKSDEERPDTDYAYPNPNEVFYLEIAHLDGMTEINNVDFKFMYMKAEGTYVDLVGSTVGMGYNVIKEANKEWRTDYDRPSYSTETTTICIDDSCTSDHKYVDGVKYHTRTVTSYPYQKQVTVDYTIKLVPNPESFDLQDFAYAAYGKRWYEYTSLSTNVGWEDFVEHSIKLEKINVDASGNPIPVDKDETFEFDVTVAGKSWTEVLTIKQGERSVSKFLGTYTWKKGETAPSYSVTEKPKEGWEIYQFASNTEASASGNTISGVLSEDVDVTLSARNEQEDKHGKITIEKEVVQDELADDEYYFNIYINGNLWIDRAKISKDTDWKYESPEYTWKGSIAPGYEVVEVDKDGLKITEKKDNLKVSITNEKGKLDPAQTVFVKAINEGIFDTGVLIIAKEYKNENGESIEGKEFHFSVKVDGHEEQIISIKSGEIKTLSYTWYKEAPSYTVTELDDVEEAKIVDIVTTNGTKNEDGRSVTGTLIGKRGKILPLPLPMVIVKAINEEIAHEAFIRVEKKLITASEKDEEFEFEIEINNNGNVETYPVKVTVPEGTTEGKMNDEDVIRVTWKEGQEVPTYTVKEKNHISYELKDITSTNGTKNEDGSISGILVENDTIVVTATNDKGTIVGALKINKEIVDKDGKPVKADKDVTFEFDIKVNNNGTVKTESFKLIVPEGESKSPYKELSYSWKDGENAPTYEIKEVKINGKYEQVEITNGNGQLKAGEEVPIEVNAINRLKEDDESGSLVINKKIVDKNGNPVKADEDTKFEFVLKVNNKGTIEEIPVSVIVLKGNSEASSEEFTYTWKKGEIAPTYEITETKINGKYEELEITNRTGSFEDGKEITIPVQATNKLKDDDESGSIVINKKIVDKNGDPVKADEDTKFEFVLKVNNKGTIEEIPVSVVVLKGNSEASSDVFTYTWKKGETAPTYEITETKINGKYKELEITNRTGSFEDGKEIAIPVQATNQLVKHEGKIQILKTLVLPDGTEGLVADEDTPFGFEMIVDNNGKKTTKNIALTVKKGESTAISDEYTFTWNEGEKAPTYKITETNEGKYKFYSISASGKNSVEGKTVCGSLEENKIILVTAKNTEKKDKEHSGSIVIKKKVLDSEGNSININENMSFVFNVKINNNGKITEEKVSVLVEKGHSEGISREITQIWKDGQVIPSYEITEISTGNYKPSDPSAKGNFVEDSTTPYEVERVNIADKLHGGLKIYKKVDSEVIKSKEFKFKLYKNNEEYKTVTVSVDHPYQEEFTWNAFEDAPVIKIEEIDLPANTELIGYINNETTLIMENGEIKEVVIESDNKTIVRRGKIEVTKILKDSDGTEMKDVEAKFNISVEGYEDRIITVKSGETWRSDYYYWDTEENPKYTVTELNDENYEFVSISAPDATVSGKSVTGYLKDGETEVVPVTAENKTKDEHEGSIKVTKVLEAEDKINLDEVKDRFDFQIKIYYDDPNEYFEYGGQKYNSKDIVKSVNGQGSTDPVSIKWYGDKAPKYYIQEINVPNAWKLKSIEPNSGNMKTNEEIEVICINEQIIQRKIYLTMELGGKVWNDTNYEDGKPSDVIPNGKIDETEEGLEKIKVTVYKVIQDSAGQIVNREIAKDATDIYENILEQAILYTDSNGIWKISKISVPALTSSDKENGWTKDAGYKGSYDVEFTYDGQTYEPTTFLEYSNGDASKYVNASQADRDAYLLDSMAIDDPEERSEFNNKFAVISGKTPIDDEGNTTGQISSGDELYYTSVDRYYSSDSSSKKVSTLSLYDESGKLYPVFEMNARTSTGGLVYPFDSATVLRNTDTTIEFGVKTINYYYHAAYPYLNSINLGLVERKKSDIALEKDLLEAVVVINGKMFKYKYGALDNERFAEYPESLYKQIAVADEHVEYKLGLYQSDYYYRASMYSAGEFRNELGEVMSGFDYSAARNPDTELDIYFKYKVTVKNESSTYLAEVRSISDYYDTDMSLVTDEVKKVIDGEEKVVATKSYMIDAGGNRDYSVVWTENGSYTDTKTGKEFNRITTNALEGTKLVSGESRTIYATFKVNKALDSSTGIDNCIKLGSKYNLAEIDSYTTYNSDESLAGRVDQDSAPANVNVSEHNENSWYEDDCAPSPAVIIGLYDIRRDIDGLAWEDAESKEIQYKEKIGNGIYDSGENVIPNLTTELVEKVNVGGIDYDFIWPTDRTDIEGLGGHTIKELTGLNSQIATDSEGKYNFEGIAAGDYIVRFTYGDPNTPKYNAQDYKSTTYQVGFANESSNLVSHDLANEELALARVSDAKDDEAQRLKIIEKTQTLTYDNTSKLENGEMGDDYYMFADTAKINMNVEKVINGGILVTEENGIIDTKVGPLGLKEITYNVTNIDLGLEERSKTKIVLDKQIQEIKLIASTGEILLDAKYDIAYEGEKAIVTLDKVSSVGIENLQALNNSEGYQGFRYINIDETILQGATIELTYQVTALNTGEVDRFAKDYNIKEISDTDKANAAKANREGTFGNYLGKVYYFGANGNATKVWDDEVVSTTVHKVVDYVDNDVVFSSANNTGRDGSWTNITTEKLKTDKLVDPSIIDSGEDKILDAQSRAYEAQGKNNLIVNIDNNADAEHLTNPGFVKDLLPLDYSEDSYASSITLLVSRYYGAEDDIQDIENIVEIIQMYNDVGRRDIETVQGNCKPADGAISAMAEDDSSITERVTLSAPTGLSPRTIFILEVLAAVLGGIAILATGVVIIKKKVLLNK